MTVNARRTWALALARELRLSNLYEHQLERMTALHQEALAAMESGQAQEAQDRLARHAQSQMRCRALWQELQRHRGAAPPPESGPPAELGVPRFRGRRPPRPPAPPLAEPVVPLDGIEDEIERELEALRAELAGSVQA